MPQLIPYFYLNQVLVIFFVILIVYYIAAKYILPRSLRLQISRVFITKL